MLRLFDKAAHRLADFAAGFRLQLLHGLFNPLDLNLGLFDVSAECLRAVWVRSPFSAFLHAAQGLLFSAIGVLELFDEQFANFGFMLSSSCVGLSRPRAGT